MSFKKTINVYVVLKKLGLWVEDAPEHCASKVERPLMHAEEIPEPHALPLHSGTIAL